MSRSTIPERDVLRPGYWADGTLPPNVRLGPGTLITSDYAFRRFLSTRPDALEIGESCTMDGVHFSVGREGHIRIGQCCYFTNAVLLCEEELWVGDHVLVGWNATIADTDFHPIVPAERIRDAIACSPSGKGVPRPAIARKRVVIGNDVCVGPNATILKGVTIGDGAWIEPGALVTHDIPPRARVVGNPAEIVGEV
jgi:acetyltransferase-like isoleucine patch superfamily enzyme